MIQETTSQSNFIHHIYLTPFFREKFTFYPSYGINKTNKTLNKISQLNEIEQHRPNYPHSHKIGYSGVRSDETFRLMDVSLPFSYQGRCATESIISC
ncbi:MAG: hypothetical protein Q4C70_06765 [Planctomycetia bacterium]|nr:hypothetical protein [Planctomycetia bacterium]